MGVVAVQDSGAEYFAERNFALSQARSLLDVIVGKVLSHSTLRVDFSSKGHAQVLPPLDANAWPSVITFSKRLRRVE